MPKAVLLLVLLCVASVSYAPGLGGPFLFDDMKNIVDNPLVAMERLDGDGLYGPAYSGGNSYPDRGLARVSFALNYYFAGGGSRRGRSR